MGKAIHQYGLIQEGDRVLVGVSGGKDSLTLLHLLHERSKRVPIHYELMPVYIDLGFGMGRTEILKKYFEQRSFLTTLSSPISGEEQTVQRIEKIHVSFVPGKEEMPLSSRSSFQMQ